MKCLIVVALLSGSPLDKLVSSLCDLKARLDSRRKVSPNVFSDNMKLRQDTHHLGTDLPINVSPVVVHWL